MYESLLAQLLKHNSGSLTISEFHQIINEAACKYLIDRAEDFELTQKRIDDLSSLKKFALLVPTNVAVNEMDFENAAVVQGGGKLLDYTQTATQKFGYLRALAVGVEFNYSGNPCFTDGVPVVAHPDLVEWVPVKPMKSDKRYEAPTDYYNRPTDERPYYDFYATATSKKVMKLINNTLSRVNRIRIEYLEYPKKIDHALNAVTDIDLPIHARQEVCDLALTIQLERIESRRLAAQIQTEAMTRT